MKKKRKFKVMYSDFEMNEQVQKYFDYLNKIRQLNILLDEKLITKSEYEKVKEKIENDWRKYCE